MKQNVALPTRLSNCYLTLVFLAVSLSSSAHADLASTFGQLFASPNQTPHPAVVRVYAKDSDALASGSGTLVHVEPQHGYIITNWHVVHEAEKGQVMVVFPNGFESAATVLKMDERWDLALLKIWKPNVAPMLLSTTVPGVGEPLTIIGYGSGQYRAANGKCQYYAAPDKNSPQEMIEVSVAARQGDSGGPIVNRRGELAAVLFGSGRGITTGTHVGRVVSFLNSVAIPESSTTTEHVAADRVVAEDKMQQASFVTPQNVAAKGGVKASQYYALPPLDWSTVEDPNRAVAVASHTKQTTAPTPPNVSPYPTPLTSLESPPHPAVTAAAKKEIPPSLRVAAVGQELATRPAINRSTSHSAVASPGGVPDIGVPHLRNDSSQRATSPASGLSQSSSPLLASATRQVHPLTRTRTSVAQRVGDHTPSSYLSSKPSAAAYAPRSHRSGFGESVFDDHEVIQLPKLNLRKVLSILQAALAVFGVVTLMEKIRNP